MTATIHITNIPRTRLPMFRYICPSCPATVEVADAGAQVGHRCPKRMGKFVLWTKEMTS